MHQDPSPSFWNLAFPTELGYGLSTETHTGFESSCHMLEQSLSELGHVHFASPNVTEVWQTLALRNPHNGCIK